jgi:hypothetical protein
MRRKAMKLSERLKNGLPELYHKYVAEEVAGLEDALEESEKQLNEFADGLASYYVGLVGSCFFCDQTQIHRPGCPVAKARAYLARKRVNET